MCNLDTPYYWNFWNPFAPSPHFLKEGTVPLPFLLFQDFMIVSPGQIEYAHSLEVSLEPVLEVLDLSRSASEENM